MYKQSKPFEWKESKSELVLSVELVVQVLTSTPQTILAPLSSFSIDRFSVPYWCLRKPILRLGLAPKCLLFLASDNCLALVCLLDVVLQYPRYIHLLVQFSVAIPTINHTFLLQLHSRVCINVAKCSCVVWGT